ncbi:MAG: hypothetical protein ABI895_32635 [Deltaproteobacteria bacterium]
MKNRALVLFTLLLSGCYTTKVYTPAPASGPELRDRQWFTIGGLVPLSDPVGQQCPGGVSRAESELAFVDALIDVGLAVVGGVAGVAICSSKSGADQRACGSAGAGLVPFLFASRTVQYTCAAAGAPVATGATGASGALSSPAAPPGG